MYARAKGFLKYCLGNNHDIIKICATSLQRTRVDAKVVPQSEVETPIGRQESQDAEAALPMAVVTVEPIIVDLTATLLSR